MAISQSKNGSPQSQQNLGVRRAARVLRRVETPMVDSVLAKLPSKQASAIRHSLQGLSQQETKPSLLDQDDQPQSIADSAIFDFLNDVRQASLFAVLLQEKPQTIAALLSVMPPEFAPKVIRTLTQPRRVEIIAILSQMTPVSIEVARDLAAGLRQRIESMSRQRDQRDDGVQRIVSILRQCDRPTEWSVMRSLGRDHPHLTERVQEMLFCFNDIASLADGDVQVLVKNVSIETWAFALKRASEPTRSCVFRNLSARAAQQLRAEMDYLGEVLPSEIDRSHQRVVEVARQLGDNDQIARAA